MVPCPPQRFDCGHCDRRDAPVDALTPAVVPQPSEASDPQWRSLNKPMTEACQAGDCRKRRSARRGGAQTGQGDVRPAGREDPGHPHNDLATIYQAEGRYRDTEPLCRHALRGRLKTLGGRDPETMTSARPRRRTSPPTCARSRTTTRSPASCTIPFFMSRLRFAEAWPANEPATQNSRPEHIQITSRVRTSPATGSQSAFGGW